MLLMSYVEMQGATQEEEWFLDSRCSNHMSGDKKWFMVLDQTFRQRVKLGNNSELAVMGKGNVRLKVDGRMVIITEVFYILDLKNNLLCIGRLKEKSLAILIREGCCRIYHYEIGLIMQTMMTTNRMFVFLASIPTNACLKASSNDPINRWHQRFGHQNMKGLSTLAYKKMVEGLPILKNGSDMCIDCKVGKQRRDPFQKKSLWRALRPLQLVHSDICGPTSPNNHKRYIITLIDEYSQKMWVYFLHAKSEALMHLRNLRF